MEEEPEEETLETALEAVKREARRAKSRGAITIGAWTLSLLLAIPGVGWLTSGHPSGIVLLSLSLLCIFVGALYSPQPHHRTLEALEAVADVRAIGPLLDLLPSAFAGRRKAIMGLLTHLLPQLQEHDSALLKPSHRNQLRTTLVIGDFRQEREYLIAVLKALERIGNSEDLALVTRLAIGQSESWHERQVREAARACLPLLREHIEQQAQHGTLLRPAFAVSPEELLHPSIESADPDPTQLLRPPPTGKELDAQVNPLRQQSSGDGRQ